MREEHRRRVLDADMANQPGAVTDATSLQKKCHLTD
jgi:hypothetical protein